MKLIVLEVFLGAEEEEPKTHLDKGENIEVRVTPLAELWNHCMGEFFFFTFYGYIF